MIVHHIKMTTTSLLQTLGDKVTHRMDLYGEHKSKQTRHSIIITNYNPNLKIKRLLIKTRVRQCSVCLRKTRYKMDYGQFYRYVVCWKHLSNEARQLLEEYYNER